MTPRPAPSTDADLAHHLEHAHRMPRAVLDAHGPTEWRQWHAAEHRTRTPGPRSPRLAYHLDHHHPKGQK